MDRGGFPVGCASDAIQHEMKARHAHPSTSKLHDRQLTQAPPLGISGSLRKGSFNTAILASLGESVEERASLQILPLNDVPLYDQDADTATPPDAVACLRAAIDLADGRLIASPEYNQHLRRAQERARLASRPFGQSTPSGKPVPMLTSSTAFTSGQAADSSDQGLDLAIRTGTLRGALIKQ